MPTTLVRSGIAGLAMLALSGVGFPTLAETVTFKADLKGSAEVPPNDSKGSGTATATYDTASKQLSWTVSYSDLSGNPTGAHLHGPATPDKNAGVALPLQGNLASPFKGTATLNDAQAKALMDGMLYVNLHTATHPGGEIRGQLVK